VRVSQSGIYMIRNKRNGKCYIGSTKDRDVRWRCHQSLLRRGQHVNVHLQRAWTLYGTDSFEFVWIMDVPQDQLLDVEQEWLEANAGGYNIAQDAASPASGLVRSPETRKKIGDAQRGRKRPPPSPETRRKISESMKGKRNGLGHVNSPEARLKMSQANLGNKHFLGKHLSEETKRKIGDANRGKTRTPETLQKLSAARRKRITTEATRQKMSASQRARYALLRSRDA
jgi:group I intron endonuclease